VSDVEMLQHVYRSL